jgi:cytidylate kinase
MVITVDGPAGAGKSSVSRALAQRLGFAFLDTGALYRAVALAYSMGGPRSMNEEVLAAWLTRVEIQARPSGGRLVVLLEGRDVEPFIRNEEIAQLASQLSAKAPVRAHLLGLQRRAGEQGDLVAEGRDMGSVVFPGAQVKFFLTASNEERARRRLLQLQPGQPGLTLEQVLAEMAARDQRDAGRKLSPLRPAPDAVIVDTSDLDEAQVVQALLERVGRARAEA